jgi:hypothetical protein
MNQVSRSCPTWRTIPYSRDADPIEAANPITGPKTFFSHTSYVATSNDGRRVMHEAVTTVVHEFVWFDPFDPDGNVVPRFWDRPEVAYEADKVRQALVETGWAVEWNVPSPRNDTYDRETNVWHLKMRRLSVLDAPPEPAEYGMASSDGEGRPLTLRHLDGTLADCRRDGYDLDYVGGVPNKLIVFLTRKAASS